jgi:hypothetical protein
MYTCCPAGVFAIRRHGRLRVLCGRLARAPQRSSPHTMIARGMQNETRGQQDVAPSEAYGGRWGGARCAATFNTTATQKPAGKTSQVWCETDTSTVVRNSRIAPLLGAGATPAVPVSVVAVPNPPPPASAAVNPPDGAFSVLRLVPVISFPRECMHWHMHTRRASDGVQAPLGLRAMRSRSASSQGSGNRGSGNRGVCLEGDDA